VEGQERTVTDENREGSQGSPLPEEDRVPGPSITEILFALGLDSEIAGVTDFCDYPEASLTKPRIGGSSIPASKGSSL